MDSGATVPYGERKEISCECGCEFIVSYAKQSGHNEKETFECPKCKKEYSVMASMPIKQNDIAVIKSSR